MATPVSDTVLVGVFEMLIDRMNSLELQMKNVTEVQKQADDAKKSGEWMSGFPHCGKKIIAQKHYDPDILCCCDGDKFVVWFDFDFLACTGLWFDDEDCEKFKKLISRAFPEEKCEEYIKILKERDAYAKSQGTNADRMPVLCNEVGIDDANHNELAHHLFEEGVKHMSTENRHTVKAVCNEGFMFQFEEDVCVTTILKKYVEITSDLRKLHEDIRIHIFFEKYEFEKLVKAAMYWDMEKVRAEYAQLSEKEKDDLKKLVQEEKTSLCKYMTRISGLRRLLLG